MAELIPTRIQEEISIDYFKTFLDNNWNVSDTKYRKLLVEVWGKNGKFPYFNFGRTIKGLRDGNEWRESFEKQVLALQQFMTSRDIPFSGWKWSRGDGMMKFLNDIASDRCGAGGSLDTWNPMDIVAVQINKEDEIEKKIKRTIVEGVTSKELKQANKELLNGIMIEYIKSKDLLPISLKKINSNERGAFEESDNLKGKAAMRKHSYNFTYSQILCDLEWSTYKNEWKNAQEISYKMIQPPSVTKAGVTISVQARAFRANDTREKPQHSLSVTGAGAHLGKSPLANLEKYLTQFKVSTVYSPDKHPKIPSKNKIWTKREKDYWIARYNSLKTITIDGKRINFKSPGSYGEGMTANTVYRRDDKGKKTKEQLTGFAAALESACEADEKGLKTQHSKVNGRESGSRLTAKLWGMEWLWRYYNMSKRGTWDAFAYTMIKGAKKELFDTGPFIKIHGEQGRIQSQQRLRIQQLVDENTDLIPMYDAKLVIKTGPKKGTIPDSKKIPKNIVGYAVKEGSETDDFNKLRDALAGEVQGEDWYKEWEKKSIADREAEKKGILMTEHKRNTSS